MVVEWWSIIPFVLLLVCIAVLPLIPATEAKWEKNTVKLAVALACGLPIAAWFIAAGHGTDVVHALVEYGQFIMLLLALFVVSGGIFLAGDIRATPRNNTIFLTVGALIASFIGTTGAAMLLIRPLLNTNRARAHKVHTVVFTIFVVANSGGLLTPLGDPPLFLGMLRGVPFAWTFTLWGPWLFVNILMLLTYYALDRRAYARESAEALALDNTEQQPLRIRGAGQFAFFAIVIAAVAFAPSIDLAAIEAGNATWAQMIPWREVIFALVVVASYLVGSREVRFTFNRFTWTPILEVAALFAGIFLAMIPALKYLAQVAPNLPLGRMTLFIFSGGLSAVLDNAPTYATFFEMATQLPGEPRIGFGAGIPEVYLISISLGAVLWGAVTYIGNGPNFMVKAVADGDGVRTPSFGGYIGWSFRYLIPVLGAMALVFLTDGVLWVTIGWVAAIALVGQALWLMRGTREPARIDA